MPEVDENQAKTVPTERKPPHGIAVNLRQQHRISIVGKLHPEAKDETS